MPHLVLTGEFDLARYAADFKPILLRRSGDVLRADQVYLAADHQTALIEALTVEAGRKQPFYLKLSLRDRGSLTLRIDPKTRPERSVAVRELITALAEDLLERYPKSRIDATNLVIRSPFHEGDQG